METVNAQRQDVIEAIESLPPAALSELLIFIAYLRFKLTRQAEAPASLADHQPAPTPIAAQEGAESAHQASPYDILSQIATMPVECKDDQLVGNEHDQIIYNY